jgi:hypothetical protein
MRLTPILLACAGLLTGCASLEPTISGTDAVEVSTAPLAAQCRRLVCEFPPVRPSRLDTPGSIDAMRAAVRRWEALCGPLPLPKTQERVE